MAPLLQRPLTDDERKAMVEALAYGTGVILGSEQMPFIDFCWTDGGDRLDMPYFRDHDRLHDGGGPVFAAIRFDRAARRGYAI